MINENDLRQAILELGKLEVAIEDIQSMSHDDYALARKNYFGASDSSEVIFLSGEGKEPI